jgi:hypothetical protein
MMSWFDDVLIALCSSWGRLPGIKDAARIDEIRARLAKLASISRQLKRSKRRFSDRAWSAVLEARAARKKLNGELPAPAARKSATGGRHSAPSAS